MSIYEALLSALLISLRVVIPGWVYCASSTTTPLRKTVKIIQVGLCLNLFPLLVLSPCSWWTVTADWSLWLVLVLVGAGTVLRKSAPEWKILFSTTLFMLVTTLLVLSLPARSEWLAGGWDPGIYQNNAIAISHANGLGGKSDTVYSQLTLDGLYGFSETEGAYREVLPGVPVNEETRQIPFYFFHLTPIFGAWIFRLAGGGGLVRLPMLLGVWMIPVVWRLLDVWAFKKLSFVGILLWWSAPLWLYQLAIPTSEILYIFFLLSALIALSVDDQSGIKRKVWIGSLMFLATVNHFNFPIVGGLILFAYVWMKPLNQKNALALSGFAGLWMGVLWDVLFAGVTLGRLEEKDQAVTIVLAGLLLFTLLSLIFNRFSLPPKIRKPLDRLLNLGFIGFGSGMTLFTCLQLFIDFEQGFFHRLQTFIAFCGPGPVLISGLGILLIGLKKDRGPWALRAGVLGLLLLFGLFMLHPGIAPIYPWALRRYIAVALPMFTACSLFAFSALWPKSKSPLAWIPVGILALGFVSVLPLSRDAAKLGDYRGITGLVDEILTHLEPGDVVVADDPRWGTPLFLSHQVDVINGKHIWEDKDPASRQDKIQELVRLESEGNRRILWLTSTSSAMGHYPDTYPIRRIIIEKRFLTYPVVIHSPKADHFASKTLNKPFGLYELELPPPPAGNK